MEEQVIELIKKIISELEIEILEYVKRLTKTETSQLYIDDINPYELNKYLKDNNVPENCYFSIGDCDGQYCYDSNGYVKWNNKVPLSEEDKKKEFIKQFNSRLSSKLHKLMQILGIKLSENRHLNNFKIEKDPNIQLSYKDKIGEYCGAYYYYELVKDWHWECKEKGLDKILRYLKAVYEF
ncbi:MAG: hypothetical protein LBM96_06055 [Methanobrevibacter sp.]|jgi:hypothetical protein|nr:hypothetical protein [Candidatus Methanoflexus mossambicus]